MLGEKHARNTFKHIGLHGGSVCSGKGIWEKAHTNWVKEGGGEKAKERSGPGGR